MNIDILEHPPPPPVRLRSLWTAPIVWWYNNFQILKKKIVILPSSSCIFCDETIITLKLFELQRNTTPKPITIIRIIIKKGSIHLVGLSILRYIMIIIFDWQFELFFCEINYFLVLFRHNSFTKYVNNQCFFRCYKWRGGGLCKRYNKMEPI